MPDKANDESKRKRLSLTSWIVIGLVAGVACGLFFGEYTEWVKWIGDAYVGLLQMAVLPYVAVSLVVNIGGLSLKAGVRLMRVSVQVLLLLWAIGIVSLVIMSLSFPVWETGSFFSSRIVEEPPAHNWMELFVPSNPFRALSLNLVPAVVVFCIGLGIALMTLSNKDKLLEPLNVLADGLASLNKLVVKLTPIGMFGIVAYTTGTIDFAQFNLIQGYLLTYGASAFVVAFIVLPALVTAITPYSFGQISKASRDPLVAAFVIGNSFVVLPMVIEAIERLQEEQPLADETNDQGADYLVPLAYPFPDIGRIIGLIFIPFAAWFYGSVIGLDKYPALMGVGILGSFGKPVITIPLLLNIAELPGDIFNLFLASGVIAARFGDLMKTMHLMAFTILTISILSGTARFRPARLLMGLAGSVLLLVVAAFLIRVYLNDQFKDQYSKEDLLTERQMVFPEDESRPVEARLANTKNEFVTPSAPNPLPIEKGQTRVERIQQHGKIRIGYDPNRRPFSYMGGDKDLTGFDIQMAYYLADDLGVGIEFVRINEGRQNETPSIEGNDVIKLPQQLNEDHFDIAMSALEGSVIQATLLPAAEPYMEVTLATVVPDHQKHKFRDRDSILSIPNLKLAVVKNGFFAERVRKILPSQMEVVYLDSAAEYFEGRHREVHGLVINAESGSAWTLRYPEFSVTNPLKGSIRVPLYYMTAADARFEDFLQNWMTLKKSDGTYQRLYDYWILGRDEESKTHRWCILRDVLGWVK